MPQVEARLTAGDPIKNARALLRYALPIKNESARRIQVCMLQHSCYYYYYYTLFQPREARCVSAALQ